MNGAKKIFTPNIQESLLNIHTLGSKLLRKKSAQYLNAEEIKNSTTQRFIQQMFHTLNKDQGIGLAAPQVGLSKRLFVVDLPADNNLPKLKPIPRTVFINPKITPLSDKKFDCWEGCLSVPTLIGRVRRFKEIRVDFMDENGISKSIEANGFIAAMIQHENDHLDGVIYIDHVDVKNDLMFVTNFHQNVQVSAEMYEGYYRTIS